MSDTTPRGESRERVFRQGSGGLAGICRLCQRDAYEEDGIPYCEGCEQPTDACTCDDMDEDPSTKADRAFGRKPQ